MTAQSDLAFTGSVPEFYDRHLVPLIFVPYAADMADRVAALRPASVLEIAAGTGAVTRALCQRLDAVIVATDLNQAMLDQARSIGTSRPVQWQQADAAKLPFENASFDVVACQFGVMFFPDKPAAFAEARRVLRPSGKLIFNVWDRIEENEFASEVTRALASLFPSNPPEFLLRTPHGYHDLKRISQDLISGGFAPDIQTVTLPFSSPAESALEAASAYCLGTPLRGEIEAGGGRLEDAVEASRAAIAARFGDGPIQGKIQAHVVMASPAS